MNSYVKRHQAINFILLRYQFFNLNNFKQTLDMTIQNMNML